MENIFLVHVYINHVVHIASFCIDVVLDRVDAMININFLARYVTCKATNMVVQCEDIRIKALNQIIKCFKRRNLTTCRYFNIGTERTNPFVRMAFRISMYSKVRFIKMHDYIFFFNFLFRNQNRNRRTLRVVVLFRYVKDVSTDNAAYFR